VVTAMIAVMVMALVTSVTVRIVIVRVLAHDFRRRNCANRLASSCSKPASDGA
jgi:hypothetical protein